MKVEIWSDVVCPWCYIGKRRFEGALAHFAHRDQVEVHWRSYQLDPHAQATSDLTLNEMLAKKYGMSPTEAAQANQHVSDLAEAEGLTYHLENAKPANTFDAHRLIHLAAAHGLQDQMKERLLKAYFTEGQPVGESQTLVDLAGEVGIDPDEARTVLAGEAYSDEVIADEREARALGCTGVPFFVIDDKYGVSGAQPQELFQQALTQIWAESHPLTSIGARSEDVGTCSDDSCAL